MASRRLKRPDRRVGGGGARNPASLANLRQGPPAAAGNLHHLRHGGYAKVAAATLEAKALEIYDAVASDAPLRDADGGLPRHDSVQVRLLADVLCRLDSVGRWLEGRWATPEAASVLELESRLRREASDYLDALGMSPRSRARLGIDLARTATLEDLRAEGREAWARNAHRGLPTIDQARDHDGDDAA
jgi:hypothetical protein